MPRCSLEAAASTVFRYKLLLILNLWRPARLQTIALKLADEARRQFSQPLDVDATGPCDVTHCEIDRRKPHMLGKVFVPGGAAVGARHQLLKRRPTRSLICNERGTNIFRMRQRPVEGNC